MIAQQYVSFLETLVAIEGVIALLALMIALLAWRWRPLPVDRAQLHPWERKLLSVIQGHTN